jgi:SAM-dependent methyltransferase
LNERHSEYVHGTAPEEQRRLSALNDLLNASSLRQIGVRPGERILDVGSGLAQLTRDLARAAGRPALGIERSAEQIAEALRQAAAAGETSLIELREGDARALPLAEQEWGAFDLAHARFVLEHVPDPLEVVRQMARAVKPGGRVVLEDDDHEVLTLHPEPAGFSALWSAYMRTYSEVGNDPRVGRKLVALLHDAGLSPKRNTWLFFGSCAGEAQFEALVSNMLKLIGDQRERISRAGALDATAFDAAFAALRAWGERKDAAIWFARCWAEGVK